MRKILFVVCAVVLLFPACIPASVANNKYYYGAYTNLTPAINNTFWVGNPTAWWAGGYFANLTVGGITFTGNTTVSPNATYATTAGYAISAGYATNAGNATYASTAGYAGSSGTSSNSTYASTAGYAGSAGTSTTSGYATTAGNADTVDTKHSTDFVLRDGTQAMTGSLNMGTTGNITLAAGMTVDGVDISALSASSGNVTANGTIGYVPLFSTSTNLTNSIMTGNTTFVTVAGGLQATKQTLRGNLTMAGTSNITMQTGMTVDGVDISALSASSGNVTAKGVATYIPQFTTATNLTPSIMTGNTTFIKVNGGIQATRQTLSGNLTMVGSNITMQSGMLVDGVDVSGHASRHQFMGADQLGLKPLLMATASFAKNWGYRISTVTGTGYDWCGSNNGFLGTGTTTNSTAGATGDSIWVDNSYGGGHVMFGTFMGGVTPSDLDDIWIGYFDTSATFPNTTSKHWGFRLVSTVNGQEGDLYATNGDGTTETSTFIVRAGAGGFAVDLVAIYGASNIKYYLSYDGGTTWALVATHTTNRPTGLSMYSGAWIKNGEAVDKQVQIIGFRFASGD